MSLYQKILSLLLTVSVLFFSGCNAIDNQSKQNDSLATTTYSETSITTAPTEKNGKGYKFRNHYIQNNDDCYNYNNSRRNQ